MMLSKPKCPDSAANHHLLCPWSTKKMEGKQEKHYSKLTIFLICCCVGLCIQCLVYFFVYPDSQYVTNLVNVGKGIISRTFSQNDRTTYGQDSICIGNTNSKVVQTIKPIYNYTLNNKFTNTSTVLNNSVFKHEDDVIFIPDNQNVAMGCAIKWVRRKGDSWNKFINKHPLFRYFLPSF